MDKFISSDEKKLLNPSKTDENFENKRQAIGADAETHSLLGLQQQVGNQAVQRLIAQRSSDGSFALDDETANQINQARGGGQALDSNIQMQMGAQMAHDFSDVRVHTSNEADSLSQQLGAQAFTTGNDIFFKDGAYTPGSSSGQELIAHELTHVVQQSAGSIGGGSQMTVNAPDDVYEQEAEAVAKSVTGAEASSVQRQTEDDELMAKREDTVQRQTEEEDLVMEKPDEAVQREEIPEEEMV